MTPRTLLYLTSALLAIGPTAMAQTADPAAAQAN